MSEIAESEFAIANQKAWDKALECFKNGDDDTQAIQKVWQVMPPPAPLPTLATIIGAIYADAYWATTKLDPTLLSASLQAAGGWNKPDCDKAAAIAFSTWCGMMVRANFGDDGLIPKPGSVTESPDVVVDGKTTLAVQQLISKWNQYIYDPVIGTKNYAYGRAQSINIQVPVTQPVLRMYYSEAGFNPPPTSWTEMLTFGFLPTSPMQGVVPGPINPGDRAANVDPFNFPPAGGGHYCLIAVVGTEYFKNLPSIGTGNWNSLEWITNNGAAGWHNIDVPNSNEEKLKFHNQDSRPERITFEAHCSFLPPGTVVSLECGDSRLTSPIVSDEVRIARDYQLVSAEAEVPPNFSGDLTVRFHTPDGTPLPPGSSVDVRMLWNIPQGHPHYLQAVEYRGNFRANALGEAVRLQMGNFVFVGGEK